MIILKMIFAYIILKWIFTPKENQMTDQEADREIDIISRMND